MRNYMFSLSFACAVKFSGVTAIRQAVGFGVLYVPCIFRSSSFLYVGFAGLGKVASVPVLV